MNATTIGLAAALALLVGVYQAGTNAERKRGEAASLRATVATLRADLDIARTAEADSQARAAVLNAASAADQETLHALQAEIARRGAADRCALSRDDAQRLLRLR